MNLTLAVMVKNEAATLPRLIDSVKGIVNDIVALDTGSTDNSVALLRDGGALVFEEPFVNFAVSRTRLCELAKGIGDYMLLADADFVFENNGFVLNDGQLSVKDSLKGPCYSLMLRSGNLSYSLPRILKANRDWIFKGVVHEYIEGTENAVPLATLSIDHMHDGARSHGNKFLSDLALLVEEHLKHPDDPRTVFYLANTMRDLGMSGCAQLYYKTRAKMGGWDEEAWYAQREAARLSEKVPAMMEAFRVRPWRAEPLMDVVRLLTKRGQNADPFDAMRKLIAYPPQSDILFIEPDCYCGVS